MGKRSKIPKEIQEHIKSLAKEGYNYREITKNTNEKFDINIPYSIVNYYGKKVRNPERKERIEINFIESITDLCQNMSVWVNKLQKEYDNASDWEVVGEDYKGKPVAIQPKRDIRIEINRSYRNFVELLKTPIAQNSQVNILQQRMETALKEVMYENELEDSLQRVVDAKKRDIAISTGSKPDA